MSFSLFGVGKWFAIVCLLIILVTPIFADLDSYKWNVNRNGNTYTFEDPNSIDTYEEIGTKMLGGFKTTISTLSGISSLTDKIMTGISKIFGMSESTDNNNDGTPDNLEDTLFDPCYVNPNIGSCIGA